MVKWPIFGGRREEPEEQEGHSEEPSELEQTMMERPMPEEPARDRSSSVYETILDQGEDALLDARAESLTLEAFSSIYEALDQSLMQIEQERTFRGDASRIRSMLEELRESPYKAMMDLERIMPDHQAITNAEDARNALEEMDAGLLDEAYFGLKRLESLELTETADEERRNLLQRGLNHPLLGAMQRAASYQSTDADPTPERFAFDMAVIEVIRENQNISKRLRRELRTATRALRNHPANLLGQAQDYAAEIKSEKGRFDPSHADTLYRKLNNIRRNDSRESYVDLATNLRRELRTSLSALRELARISDYASRTTGRVRDHQKYNAVQHSITELVENTEIPIGIRQKAWEIGESISLGSHVTRHIALPPTQLQEVYREVETERKYEFGGLEEGDTMMIEARRLIRLERHVIPAYDNYMVKVGPNRVFLNSPGVEPQEGDTIRVSSRQRGKPNFYNGEVVRTETISMEPSPQDEQRTSDPLGRNFSPEILKMPW